MTWEPNYLTVPEGRAYLRIQDGDDDTEIAAVITAASRAIDLTCNRQFGIVAAAEVRYYTAAWDRELDRWIIEIDDLMTTPAVGAITVQDGDGTPLGIIDKYTLTPRNAASRSRPWTEIIVKPDAAIQPTGVIDEVAAVALWGWSTVPVPIKQACYLQMNRLLARRDSPYGVAGSPDLGSELRLLARLDPDVAVSVSTYRRWWGAA